MIYLDNAATTIDKPQCVIDAVTHAMTSFGNPGRGAHSVSLDAMLEVYKARRAISSFFNAPSPSSIAFTKNATEALNAAIYGLFKPGDHIISTVCEHNSVLRPLHLMSQNGIDVSYIPTDKNGVICYDAVERLIKHNTKAFIVTHASNVTGNITELDFFRKLKDRYGLVLIVDGAQTAGAVPVDIQKQGIDVFCFTGHKALRAPQGTGGIFVSPELKIRPLLSGGSGMKSYDPVHPQEMPDSLEAGTLNSHGIAGLRAAVEYTATKGIDFIAERENMFIRRLYDKLRAIDGLTIYGDFSDKLRAPIISLNIQGVDSGKVSDILASEYDIATRPGAHCAPLMHKALGTTEIGAVRFSLTYSNTEAELDSVVSAVREIADEFLR